MKLNKGFTVIEMMIVVLILGVGLIGVMETLSYSYSFLYNLKGKVTALNIARGGVEGVFSMRNTNWQRWGGQKDMCWLKINPLVDKDNDGCENDDWFGSGSYILSITGSNQKYFSLSKVNTKLATTGEVQTNDYKFLVDMDKNGYLNAKPSTSRPNNYFDSTLYFRQIRGGYLLDKQANDLLDCDNGKTDDNGECGNGRTLEKNFCVDVVYFDGVKHKISFCSILTNFKK